MKKLISIILLSAIAISAFASGHGLEGIGSFFTAGVFIIGLPLLLLIYFSDRAFRKPGGINIGVSLVLLVITLNLFIFFYSFFYLITGPDGLPIASMGLFVFIAVVVISIILLFRGYRKKLNQANAAGEEVLEMEVKENYSIIGLVSMGLAYGLIVYILDFALQKMAREWFRGPVKYFVFGLNMIYASLPFAFALSLKQKKTRIVVVIIGILLIGYLVYHYWDWAMANEFYYDNDEPMPGPMR